MRSPARRWAALAVAVVAIALSAALASSAEPPYVVTAIDYHFHDAHPTVPIGQGRDLVVKNASVENTHNVTIEAIGFSEDVPPGDQIVIGDIASRFAGPGEYQLFCRYHRDRGMTGIIVIASG